MADLSSDYYQRLLSVLDKVRQTVSPNHNNYVAGAVDPMKSNPIYGMLMGTTQGDVLNNHVPKMYGPSVPTPQVQSSPLPPVANAPSAGAPGAPSPPISGPQAPTGFPAQVAALNPDRVFQPSVPLAPNNGAVPMPMARPQQAPQQQAAAAVPMPQARPADAPQPMGFFARNTAMMRDPLTQDFIDPTAASNAQSQNGSALISKMLGYLNNKADNGNS